MSPTTTEPNELDQRNPQPPNRETEEPHDPEAHRGEEDRRGYFQKHPAARLVSFFSWPLSR